MTTEDEVTTGGTVLVRCRNEDVYDMVQNEGKHIPLQLHSARSQISTDIGSIREVGEVQRDASIDGHHAVEEAETASNREEHSLIDNGNEEDDTIKDHEDINKGIEADGGLSKEVPFRFLGHQ